MTRAIALCLLLGCASPPPQPETGEAICARRARSLCGVPSACMDRAVEACLRAAGFEVGASEDRPDASRDRRTRAID